GGGAGTGGKQHGEYVTTEHHQTAVSSHAATLSSRILPQDPSSHRPNKNQPPTPASTNTTGSESKHQPPLRRGRRTPARWRRRGRRTGGSVATVVGRMSSLSMLVRSAARIGASCSSRYA